MRCDNHRSAAEHLPAIRKIVADDILHWRELVFPRCHGDETAGLRVSPIGVIDKPQFRSIYELSFTGDGNRISGGAMRNPRAPRNSSGSRMEENIIALVICGAVIGSDGVSRDGKS